MCERDSSIVGSLFFFGGWIIKRGVEGEKVGVSKRVFDFFLEADVKE